MGINPPRLPVHLLATAIMCAAASAAATASAGPPADDREVVSREVIVRATSFDGGNPDDPNESVREVTTREVVLRATGSDADADGGMNVSVRQCVSREVVLRSTGYEGSTGGGANDAVRQCVSREVVLRATSYDSGAGGEWNESVREIASREVIAFKVGDDSGSGDPERDEVVTREVMVLLAPLSGGSRGGDAAGVAEVVTREVVLRGIGSDSGTEGGPAVSIREIASREVILRQTGSDSNTQGGVNSSVREVATREVPILYSLQPPCESMSIDPITESVGSAQAIRTCTVATNDEFCRWSLVSEADWILAVGSWEGIGTGGTVTYRVLANPSLVVRQGTLRAGTSTLVITQLGAPDCNGNEIGDQFEMAQGLVPDCDGNGTPDPCDVEASPWRDFDGSGTLDVCEGRTFWIGGASGALTDASSWSGGLPSGAVPAVFDTGGAVTVSSSGGALGAPLVVRSGSVTLVASAPLSVPSLSVESGASLLVSGRLTVLGGAEVLTGGRLSLRYDGWLSVGGLLDCRPQSSMGLGLRLSDEPLMGVGSGSFQGGIEVDLGSVSPWTVESGTRFTLVETQSLESDGFFASLFSPGLGPNVLAVVGPGSSIKGIERLQVEVIPLSQLLQPQDDGYTSVTGSPTALEVAPLTDDGFDDTAVTVSFGADADGLLYALEGDGKGGFKAQASYPTDRDPRGVRAGRFDDTDQTLDLAVTSAGSATLRAYRNLSQAVGGFVAGPAAPTVADPRALASVTPAPAGTSLQAGTDAVVVAGVESSALQGFSSDGAGVFVAENVIQLERRPRGVSTVPGSSRPDRGVTAALSGNGQGDSGEVVSVSVSPDGDLVLTGSALGPSAPTDVECRDLDGDGLPDVVVTAENGSVSVLRGTPTGLAASGSFPAGALPARDGALGDFNGDGRLDIAVASKALEGSSGSKVSVFLNESVPGGVPTFRPAGSFAEGEGVRLLESGKLTADTGDGLVTISEGVPDGVASGGPVGVVTVVRFTTPQFEVCLGDMDGNRAINAADLTVLLTLWGLPGLADLTGDGVTDAVDLASLLASWGPCDR